MNIRTSRLLAGLFLALLPAGARGQGSRVSDSFAGTLQQAAIDTDPRTRQLQLFMQQTDLRLRNISVQRLPSITVDGQVPVRRRAPLAGAAAHRRTVQAAEGHV